MQTRYLISSISHHAYCIAGTDNIVAKLKSELVERHSIPTSTSNPDYFESHYDTLSIEDARKLRNLHDTMPIGETGKRIFVISINNITIEAQNALLKLLEEPAQYAHFFLIIPSAHLLLPTVRSRLNFLQNKSSDESANSPEAKVEAEKFLKLTKAKRLDYIKNFLDEITKEKRSKREAVEFINSLEKYIYDTKGVKEGKVMLEDISLIRKYLNDRAPSLKMLLEYVALKV